MRIREIRNSQDFQDLCQQVLAAEYDDFQVLDDSAGDQGNDGFIPSSHRLFAIYCPEKHPTPAKYYKDKIKKDLNKAVRLRDELDYEIDDWIFVTPSPLTEDLNRYVSSKAKAAGFRSGISWSEKHILKLLLKHDYLKPLFPCLAAPDIQKELQVGFAETTRFQGESLSIQKEILSTLITKLDVSESARKFADRVSGEYDRRLRSAKELFDQGLYIRAGAEYRKILKDLKQDDAKPESILFFKACTNAGLCDWHLGELKSATGWFYEAYSFHPNDKKAISNLATAQMFEGDSDTALKTVERALGLDPYDEDSITIKANVLYSLGRIQDAVAYLESTGHKTLQRYFNGLRLHNEESFVLAANTFQELLNDDSQNVDYIEHAATNLLLANHRVLREGRILPWRMPTDVRKGVKEAERLFTQAIDLLKNKEVPHKLVGLYINRSASRTILGQFADAVSDCDEALRIEPESSDAYLNKSKANGAMDDFESAISSIDMYLKLTGSNDERVRERIFYFYMAGRFDRAKDLLVSKLDREIGKEDLLSGFLAMAINVLDFNQDFELSDELLGRIEEKFPEHSAAMVIRAKHLMHTGKQGAETLLRRALELAEPPDVALVTVELAGYLFQNSNYSEALSLYESVIGDQEVTPLHYNYLLCLYYTGRFKDAVEFAEKIKGEVDVDLKITPIEAAAHIGLWNYSRAAELLLAIYQRDLSRVDYLVEYGICLFKLDQKDRALKAFDQARNRTTKTKELMALAQGYYYLGQFEAAIDLSYQALQQSPHLSRVHMVYVSCYLGAEQAGNLPDDQKYLLAFQDSISNFQLRFPSSKNFVSIDVKEDLSGLTKLLDQSEARSSKIIQLYQAAALPIYALSVLRHRDLFTVWSSLISSNELGIRMALGHVEEQRAEEHAMLNCKRVVVDLLALFTLQRTGQLSLLEKLFDRPLVHQAVFEELLQLIMDERNYVREGRKTIGKVNGQYFLSESSPEAIQEELSFLETIKDYIRQKTDVSGLNKELQASDQRLVEVFGTSASNPAVLAAQEFVPLLSDDALLRSWIRTERNTEAFQPIVYFSSLCPNAFCLSMLTMSWYHSSYGAIIATLR